MQVRRGAKPSSSTISLGTREAEGKANGQGCLCCRSRVRQLDTSPQSKCNPKSLLEFIAFRRRKSAVGCMGVIAGQLPGKACVAGQLPAPRRHTLRVNGTLVGHYLTALKDCDIGPLTETPCDNTFLEDRCARGGNGVRGNWPVQTWPSRAGPDTCIENSPCWLESEGRVRPAAGAS